MSEIYTLTKQISRSNYQSEEEFISKIKMVVQDHYENFHFERQDFKELFRKHDLLDIVMFDIANFWEESVELGFDFSDYKTPEGLIEAVIQTVNTVKLNEEVKESNIVIQLNTYFLSAVSFQFSA
jgi:hypothetical protein